MRKLLFLLTIFFAGCEEVETKLAEEPICKTVTVKYYLQDRLVGQERKEFCSIPPDSVVLPGIGKVKAGYFP